MDRIAIISDIHGNLPALEATLADIKARGIERIFCLGDLVGKGPDSAAVTDICRAVCEKVILGNWDDALARRTDLPPPEIWYQEQLGHARLSYLAALPTCIDFWMSGRRVRLFHASPTSIYRRIFQNDGDDKHASLFEDGELTDAGFKPDVVGYGDIHVVFMRHLGPKTLFNVGSVGNSLDFPQAFYTILEGVADSEKPAPLSIQFMHVPYDIELAIQQAKDSGMPYFNAYAHELRTGQYIKRSLDMAW